MVKRELELLRLRLIEFHVVHHCNLNCEGCSHFAPSAPKSIVLSSEIEKQVILASKKLAPEFVHILGGEPLLHPELEMLLPIFFKAFPSAKLKLVTNGILLNKKINKLLPSLKENNVVLSISIYKNTILDKDLLINKLNTLGVEYELWQPDCFLVRYLHGLISEVQNYRCKMVSLLMRILKI
jgi:ABC-2 type transport system ATP-binding protein